MADWCHAFDFRAGKQGWKELVYGGKPHATWQDCVGWARNNAITEARVIESPAFPQSVITKAEIHLSIPPTQTTGGPMYCFNTPPPVFING
ncbi:MAG: hypothetical protein HZC41_02185 [Chloroflexi bacterium]|nr:hypothetical protein [Chloroflexota bacterium]